MDSERSREKHILGVSSNGEVFSVADNELERRVAVKIPDTDASGWPDLVRRFRPEARLAAPGQDPSAPLVRDVGPTDDGQPAFYTDLVTGRTLASALGDPAHALGGRGSARIDLVVSIFIDVCKAMALVHHHDIVHQDIKPENIFIGDLGEVLVLDWDHAFGGRSTVDAIYGTPLYMSPEQAKCESADARSDIHCIGASLFHALTLRCPIRDEDPDRFLAKKCRGDIEPLTPEERAAVPERLIAIAMKAMAPDPADRQQKLAGMIREFEAYRAASAVGVHRDSAIATALCWYRRHVVAFWLGTVAIAMLAALIVVVSLEAAKRRSAWLVVYSSPATDGAEMAKAWVGKTMSWSAPKPRQAQLGDPDFFTYGPEGAVIHSHQQAFTDLCYAHPFQGSARVEWDAVVRNRRFDLNCFISASDRLSGYTFHVGGFGDPTSVVLTRGSEGTYQRARLPSPLATGVRYHFVMEREDHRVSLSIDGVRVIDALDRDTLDAPTGSGFGFDTCSGSDVVVSSIRVSSRPVPRLVPVIAIADNLFRMRLYADARAQYAEIYDTYRGTDLAAEALFRMALCDLRGGSDAEGLAGMVRYELECPTHERLPEAWYERARIARASGDIASAVALEAKIKQHRGNPALRRMFFDAAERFAVDLAWQPIKKVGDRPYPDDLLPRLLSHLDVLAELSWLSGVPLDKVIPDYTRALSFIGAHEVILSRFDNDDARASALIAQGRFDEALRLYPHQNYSRSAALMNSGRLDEVIKDPDTDGHPLVQSLYELGRIDDAPAHLHKFYEWQLRAGRAEEILASPQDDPIAVDRALLALGRPAEVLARTVNDSMACEALCALGRYEEVMDHPSAYDFQWITALHRYADGRTAEARALIHLLTIQGASDHDSRLFFARWILPIFLDALEGAPEIPERFEAVAREQPFASMQRPAHYALFLAGAIDVEAFKAQPYKRRMRANLLFVQAMRAELLGDRATAHARYQEIVELPVYQHDDEGVPRDFIGWRLRATAP